MSFRRSIYLLSTTVLLKVISGSSLGSFENPRATVIIDDGVKFVAETDELFDVILIDSTDPEEDGPSSVLYSEEFYKRYFFEVDFPELVQLQIQVNPWRHTGNTERTPAMGDLPS